MRAIYCFIVFSIMIYAASCTKEIRIDEPSFDVSVASTTANVSDSVIFTFSGDADYITFYSGEIGNDYDYRDKDRILPPSGVEVSFQTLVRPQTGGPANCQDNQFHLWTSTNLNFTGTTAADSANAIRNANWQEITSRFTLCPQLCSNSTALTNSGVVDIIDLFEADKPLFFAFQYVNKPNNATNGAANLWRFTAFQMNAIAQTGSSALINQTTGGWKPIFIGDNTMPSTYAGGASVTFRGNTANMGDQEIWCVSDAINITEANLGHEFGIPLKSVTEARVQSYAHKFTLPGTYTVTFVSANANVYDRKQKIHQVQMTIEP